VFYRPVAEAEKVDNEELLSGVCHSCGAKVSAKRGQCSLKAEFSDWPAAACPNDKCGATVYAFPDTRATWDRLRDALKELERLAAEKKVLEGRILGWQEANAKGSVELNRLRAENASLAARLKPFEDPAGALFDRMFAAMDKEEDVPGWGEAEEALLATLESRELPSLPDPATLEMED
jgi:hypothetical protein